MRKAAITGFVLLVLVGGWSGLWFFGAQEAARQFDAWLASEDAQGRQWTCPARAIGGYPFALTVSCRDATFFGHALGQSVQGSVAHVTAAARLPNPTRITLTLAPPFTYRSSDGATDIHGKWTSLRVDLDSVPDITMISLAGTDVALDGTFGPAGRQRMGSARLVSRVGLATSAAAPTIDFDIAVGGTDVPQIDALVGDEQPTDLHFVGRLDQADVGDARTPEEAMDRWRRAGGRINLSSSAISRGPSRVSATGALTLDDAHRPQGRLEAQFVALEPILKRYGINANLAAAGALLSALFGGGGPKQAPSDPGAITLPINLQDGHLGVGPIRTDILLPPLY